MVVWRGESDQTKIIYLKTEAKCRELQSWRGRGCKIAGGEELQGSEYATC